jgi:hypothetical protein
MPGYVERTNEELAPAFVAHLQSRRGQNEDMFFYGGQAFSPQSLAEMIADPDGEISTTHLQMIRLAARMADLDPLKYLQEKTGRG